MNVTYDRSIGNLSGAVFSEDRVFRFLLWRRWHHDESTCEWLNMVMLNPSRAGAASGDPTVDRQVVRAKRLGFGGLYVTNIFALRSTDPRLLYKTLDPVGSVNDKYIQETAMLSKMIICAWGGTHGNHMGRAGAVKWLLKDFPLYFLKVSMATGQPYHPLYLPYSLEPKLWRPGAEVIGA